MAAPSLCPECHHPDNGYQHQCPLCGRVLRVRTAWQVAAAMRRHRTEITAADILADAAAISDRLAPCELGPEGYCELIAHDHASALR